MGKENKTISCSCGCGNKFLQYDIKNRIRRFISGHNSVMDNPHKKVSIKQVCRFCRKIYYRSPSLANRGKNTYCSRKCQAKDAYRWIGGDKNPNWKNGFNGVQNIRWSPEYRIWRMKIFVRDNFICQKCKQKSSRKNPLHAHHIIKFSDSVELMFDIDNGITLCKKCHLQIHRNDMFNN